MRYYLLILNLTIWFVNIKYMLKKNNIRVSCQKRTLHYKLRNAIPHFSSCKLGEKTTIFMITLLESLELNNKVHKRIFKDMYTFMDKHWSYLYINIFPFIDFFNLVMKM